MCPPEIIRYPSEVILEITNICNLKCRFCHYHGENAPEKREPGHMDRRIWEKVLDEIRTWSVPVTLATHGAGEPLLYRLLPELMGHVSRVGNITGGFMTNGMELGPDQIQMVLDRGVQWIAFSIDGTEPATHDFFRVNAKLTQIEANVNRLIDMKKKQGMDIPQLSFNMVGYPEILDQTHDYVARWLPHASQVTVATFRPVGSRFLWDGSTDIPFQPCPLLDKQFVIGVTGDVGLCCEDIHLDVPIGNVLEQSIESIFSTSPILEHYREQHRQGDIRELKLCRDCHVWASNHVLDQRVLTIHGIRVEETVTPAYRLFRRKEQGR